MILSLLLPFIYAGVFLLVFLWAVGGFLLLWIAIVNWIGGK